MDNVIDKIISVAQVQTHLKIAGQGSPLVFFHGMGLADLCLPFHLQLAQDFTLYAPDHPGFGLSTAPDSFDSLEDFIIHYADLLDILGLKQVTLVGHSLGGWLAAEFASFFPERVKNLVLISAGGLRVANAPIVDVFALSPEQLAMVCFYDLSSAMVLASQRDLSNMKKLMLQDYKERTMVAKIAWQLGYSPKLAGRLRRITAKTLVIWGKDDQLVPLAHAEAYCQAITGAKLALLNECGHMPPLEQVEQVVQLIKDFTKEQA